MRKIAVLLWVLALLCSCRRGDLLPRDAWREDVYETLSGVISNAPRDSYAVFDFDNTTIINDISMTLMEYMADNMSFAFSPDDAFRAFTLYLPDLDTPLAGVGLSVSQIGESMSRDYAILYRKKLNGENFRESGSWTRFKKSLFLLNDGIENTFDYGTWCLWMPGLLMGMDKAQIKALTEQSVDYWLEKGTLVIPKESVDLLCSLRKKGVKTYVCSASLEVIVEALACNPKYSLGFSEDEVFGIRLTDDPVPQFEASYPQTFLEGKVKCIDRFMRVSHGGKDPILVAGDSTGDLPMLTAFPQSTCLVYDCGKGGKMGEYIAKKLPGWVVQPRSEYTLFEDSSNIGQARNPKG